MKRWATDYDKCIECGRTDRKHVSHGLCHTCDMRKWRLENPVAYKKQLKKYWATEKYKNYRKEYSKTYQQQNKEKIRNYLREWRKRKSEKEES